VTTPHERAALSRELSEFLIELSIALHKHAMYPDGHPSLAPAAAGVVRRAEQLLHDRGSLSLGVARNQLVIEGVATDPKHPVLAELSGRLHRHHLGALTFSRGVDGLEVQDMLRLLAVEADRSGKPLGLGDPAKLQAWKHLRLHPLTYERLELLDEAGPAATDADDIRDEDEIRDTRVREAQLWIGLARAALAGQIGEDETPPLKPAVIAKAIDEHPKGAAYDQVIVGYLLQIADELKTAGGAEAVELRRRTSRLVSEMRPETLRRLIEMGGDMSQRRKFVLDATHGMAVDAVLEILRAAADASHNNVSGSLMRMLSKLAAHAEQGTTQARTLADGALREQIQGLLSGWEIDDPNPTAYGLALQKMSQAAPVFATAAEASHAPEPERLVQISLEIDALGPKVWQACAALVEGGRLQVLLDLLEQAPPSKTVAPALWERAASPDMLQRLLAEEPVDFALIDRVLPRMGFAAAEPLLDALADTTVRATRRAILDRLLRLGDGVGPLLVARMADDRWYVLRNLLGLLAELAHLPPSLSAIPWLGHGDARVRLEALKLALKMPAEHDRAITQAVTDADGRVVRLALIAALNGVPPAALTRIVALATDRRMALDIRHQCIRVLGASRSAAALEVLLGLCDGGKTLLGKPKLPSKSPELLAALGALAIGFGEDGRATAVLARAAVSEDPEIRAATDPTSGKGGASG
jgi:hypothetical protein